MNYGNGYSVGYRNPPLHSRFPPRTSGNPRGRPKGRPNQGPIEKALARTTTITVAGRRKKISITEVLIMQLQQDALAGDKTARRDLLRLAVEYERIAFVTSRDLPQE